MPEDPAPVVAIFVKTQGDRDAETKTTADVRVAYRQFAQAVRRLGWRFLWVGAGLWLEAAVCTESFVVDFAETLERRRSQLESVSPRRWDSRVVSETQRRLVRVVRWFEPGARACRRLATRIDTALNQRLG